MFRNPRFFAEFLKKDPNNSPVASVIVIPSVGSTNTIFCFDVSGSFDAADLSADLKASLSEMSLDSIPVSTTLADYPSDTNDNKFSVRTTAYRVKKWNHDS